MWVSYFHIKNNIVNLCSMLLTSMCNFKYLSYAYFLYFDNSIMDCT